MSRACLIFVLVLPCGCVGGCTPDVRVPANVPREVTPLVLPLAQPTTRPATLPATRPAGEAVELSLEEARERALSDGLGLVVARLDVRAAEQDLLAERAAFDATFEVDARYARLDQPVVNQVVFPDAGDGVGETGVFRVLGGQTEATSINPAVVVPLRTGGDVRVSLPFDRVETDTGRVLNPQYEQDARVGLRLPLLRGLGSDATQRLLRVSAARLGQVRARRLLEVVRTLADVDRAYWRAWQAGEVVAVRREQLRLAAEQADRAQRRALAGDVADAERIRAESAAADARDLLRQAETDAALASRALRAATGGAAGDMDVGPGPPLVTTTQPVAVAYALDPERLAGEALTRRAELLEAELRVSEAQAEALASRNDARPRLDASYEFGVNGLGGSWPEARSVLADGDFLDHVVGLRFEQPIGNRQARARLRSALLRRAARLADVRQRELDVRREVFDAADALAGNFARLATADARVDAALRLAEGEVRRFDAGAASSLEVIDALNSLASARLAAVEAQASYELARVDLAVATGTTLGKTGVVVE